MKSMKRRRIKEEQEVQLPRLKNGLPYQAFAIVDDYDDPATWQLQHHTKAVNKAVRGKVGHYRTTDWELIEIAVASLSRAGYEGRRVTATEQQILDAASHLLRHYAENGRPVPDTLAALVEAD